MLSTDSLIFENDSSVSKRMIDYGKDFEVIKIIVFCNNSSQKIKKISENEIPELTCPECGNVGTRDFTKGKTEGESFDTIDSGYQNKVVQYSQKRNELLHERSADFSREVRKKNGIEFDK
jgi:hypothetical protein